MILMLVRNSDTDCVPSESQTIPILEESREESIQESVAVFKNNTL